MLDTLEPPSADQSNARRWSSRRIPPSPALLGIELTSPTLHLSLYNSHRRFANPAPLGLAAFSLTTFVLSMINVNAGGVKTPNIVVGLALFYGGLMQLLAGM